MQTFLPELMGLHRQILLLLGIPLSKFRQELN